MRSGPAGRIAPHERFGRPGKTLMPKFGQRKWNWLRGTSPSARNESPFSRSGPNWLEIRPSACSRYASGEMSTAALKPGCATAQW